MIASEGCSICNGHFVQGSKWYGIIRNTDDLFFQFRLYVESLHPFNPFACLWLN